MPNSAVEVLKPIQQTSSLLPADYWQVGEEVDVVFTRPKGEWLRGTIAVPNERWRITTIAHKYLWDTPVPGSGLNPALEDKYVKETGRTSTQNGFLSIVKPGTMPLWLPEDELPRRCCTCGQRHD